LAGSPEADVRVLQQSRSECDRYLMGEAVRQDVFEYFEMYYNPKRSTGTMECGRPLTSKSGSKN